ncbi:MAG: ABC transporter ATP-binding protein [Nitrospirae bacterium]|nr:ABC transporter ATP-binding protein [Nitrospirota bacterium]
MKVNLIKLEHVDKYYGSFHVLKDISFEVGKGEFLSIVGRSGSGKSTLLNIIGGMDKAESGKVIVDNEDISSYSDDKLTLYRRRKVGFIFQFFNLLPNITVFENISMPLILNNIMDEEKVKNFIKLVGLEGKEKSFPFQLSGGEQQRVAIARALIHSPEIILADEPTGSLDSETGAMIMELICGLMRNLGKTIIIVTHESYIAQYAGRIITIKDGIIYK